MPLKRRNINKPKSAAAKARDAAYINNVKQAHQTFVNQELNDFTLAEAVDAILSDYIVTSESQPLLAELIKLRNTKQRAINKIVDDSMGKQQFYDELNKAITTHGKAIHVVMSQSERY